MDFRLLGPVEVWSSGAPVDAGPPRQRCLLAALAVDAGRPVSRDMLVDRVWGSTPPGGSRHALHVHVARLRKALPEGDRLVHRSGAYLLDVAPEQTDLYRFRRLVETARRSPDAERAALLGDALRLWRGEALAGLTGDWAGRVREGWRQRRLDVVVAWAQAQLRLDRPGAIIAELQDVLTDHPLAEALAAVLITALSRAGRGAEALDQFAETRRRLVEELGVEPGPELQALHAALLRGELSRPPGPAAAGTSTAPPAFTGPPDSPSVVTRNRPAQLPPEIQGLTGRDRELKLLDGHLDGTAVGSPTVVISALSGTAGVGKTALAVHWAHRVADRFPDGQLYVNLRGFAADGAATPEEALHSFLDALGVPPDGVPAGLEARTALYRSLLSGRRMLVLLDNARDADQVRPLLPGSPGCAVLVTSRSQLPGLVAAEGARPITVDLLSTADARELLTHRLGRQRAEAEPAAVEEIVERCARLPLALAIVAARAATNPTFPLAALAAELREARGDLAAFDGGDAATQVRAVFSWSYHALDPPAARLFRLVGLHPGPDISTAAAASLFGGPPAGTNALGAAAVGSLRAMHSLARAHLVTEHRPGRYACHDLLRSYANGLAGETESEPDRRQAMDRLFDHYLHTAHRADRLLDGQRDPLELPAAAIGVRPEPLADPAAAVGWFVAEHDVLMAVLGRADDARAWRLAWTMTTYFHRQGRWHDWAMAQQVAVTAAERLGDRAAVAGALRDRALAHSRLGRFDDARADLQRSMGLYAELGDLLGGAHAQTNLAEVLTRQGRYRDALVPGQRALTAFRTAGHVAGQASALHGIGWNHAQLGDDAEAVVYCERALALHLELGDAPRAAAAWDSLGFAHHRLGHHTLAVDCFRRALDIHRQGNHRYCQAGVLTHLGDVQAAAGHPEAARAAWRSAVEILDDLGHPEAAEVRVRLGDT